MTKNKANTRTARRTLSLLLALAMLIGILPQITLPVHALGGYSERSVDGFDYCIYWSEDEWGEGTVGFHCAYCMEDYGRDFSRGDDPDDIVLDMISENLCEDCDHCLCCAPDYHCTGCKKCFENGDAEECPYCNTTLCLDCHDDDCFCDLCGNCRLNDSASGRTASGGTVELPNLHVLCDDCLSQQEECVECSNIISIGDYKTYDEAGMDWCEECGLCNACFENTKISSDYDHCIECGVCGREENVCDDCKRCETCSHDITHCSMCGMCYGDEGIDWCPDGGLHCELCCMEHNWICYQCDECMFAVGASRCDECDLCEECCAENTEESGCIHGYCIYSADYDEHVCPMCGLCPEDMECEYCGMCESCQDDYHCRHGICPENSDEWEEHLCDSCGDCFELDELCEFCHLCESCREHCDHDICPEDPDYDDHICPQCGDCYLEDEFCDDCGLCVNCCEDNAMELGCNHGLCVESYEFQSHYCFTDKQCRIYCNHNPACTHPNVSTLWDYNESSHWHVCQDCGAAVDSEAHVEGEPVTVQKPDHMTGKNGRARVSCRICGEFMKTVTIPCVEIPADGSPYILSEPKDYTGKVSDVIANDIPRYATYRVSAGGEGLTYQWYRRVNGVNATKLEDMTGDEYWYNISGEEEIHGATTNVLTVFVYGTSCYDLYEYWCVVSNRYGSVTTRYAKQDAQHVFGNYYSNCDGTHSDYCFGDGCDAVRGRPAAHRYGDWELKQAATSTQTGLKQQTCLDCGHANKSVIPTVEPGHVHSFTKQKHGLSTHWYECACGLRRNEQPHTLGEWETVKLPTVEFEGRRERRCSGCSFSESETIDKLSHVHDFVTLKEYDPRKVYDQRFLLPNGYVTEDTHVRFCAKCSSFREEAHRYGYWSLMRYPYTDSNGVKQQGIISRFCQDCGRPDSRYFNDGKWPIMTEVWNDALGVGTGGPATVSGTWVANAGDTVTVSAKAFEGYLLGDARQGYGAWSFQEVTGYEGTEICGTWYAFKNNEIKNIRVNADGSVSFTMPDGPVGLMVFPEKCDHEGAATTPSTIAATCTGYGSRVELCQKCGGVAKTTDILEPIGHDWRTLRVEEYGDCDRREVVYQECSRCDAERYRNTNYVHEWVDVNEGAEASCFKAGREPDQECRYCDATRRGEMIPAFGSHSFGEWETVKAPTNRTKGQRTRTCRRCEFTQTETLDYSGPDYRIRPDRTKLHFDFVYGEQPEPQTVTFASVGRTQATEIARPYEAIGCVTTQKLDGMTMTVTAVPWEMIDLFALYAGENEVLQVLDVNGVRLPDEDVPEIEVSANIRKTAEKYDLTVEGGKAWLEGTDSRRAGSALSAHGGDYLHLAADDRNTFLRWEIVEDESGYLPENWGYWTRHYEEPETDFYMSANPVKIKALTRDTPGVYQITFANNDGTEKKVTVYTNSRGQIDTLPNAWWANRVFDGWWTKPSGGVRADVGMTFTADTTLYAHWRTKTEAQSDPFPPLRFTKDSRAAVDGSLIVDIENMAEENDALMEAYFGGDYVTQWFRNGRLISGYNYDSLQLSEADRGSQIHAVICFNGHQIVGEDVRILGRDELPPASYTVSFDAGPGHVSPSSALTGADGKLKALPEPWRENYAFAGWYTRGLDYEKIFVDVDTVYSKDTTLYAEWEEEEQYDLEIAGTRVTSTNRNDILGDGLFSFDGDKTLTVRGSCTARRYVIYNKGVEGLIINVAKDATFMSANDWEPIKLEADTTITGTGTLSVTGGATGIYMNSKTGTLTLRNISVEAANQWGVAGPNGENSAKLVLDNAGIKAGCVTAAVCDFGGGITMKDCAIVYPRDGRISDDGTDVVDADGSEAHTVIIEAAGPAAPPDDFRFDDVKNEKAFYFAPVYWAYEAKPQITNGLDKTHFGPDNGCTRGQVVTFLWRAAGCPEPIKTETAFTDVGSKAFYAKAVAWAVENKITNGMSPTSFAPDATCTRGQIVTFLWRFRASPAPSGADTGFTDVEAKAFYAKAVAWAVENKVTNGMTKTTFAPNATCTRGQIVTFLYRAMNG